MPSSMFGALEKATRDSLTPRMLGLVLWPLLGSLLLWGLLGVFFWHDLVAGLQHWLSRPGVEGTLGTSLLHVLSQFVVTLALFGLVWPLVQATALLITATVAMPLMVTAVTQRDYPQLERRHGGSTAGSVWNGLAATAVYLVLWILTLPLWLLGLPAVLLPVLLNGWLNDRLFRYDALAEHADAGEYALLRQRAGGRFYLIGCAAAAVQLVPLLNLAVPVWSGLGFIHFGCAELTRLRQERLNTPGNT